MQDLVVSGLSVLQWWLPGLAVIAGAAGSALVIILLLFPSRPAGIPGLVPVQGALGAANQHFAGFASERLLADLPSPDRFFEQLGPDRFRRDLERKLRHSMDSHVDDVMTRRTGSSWDRLSSYARARIYNHVHQRLPFVVDDFIDRIQRELGDIVHPARLVRQWFAGNTDHFVEVFLRVHGRDLRAAMLPSILLAVLLTLPLQWLLPMESAGWLTGAAAAVISAWVMCHAFMRRGGGRWSWRRPGILQRRRERFLQALSAMVVHEALGWPAVLGEFVSSNQASRMKHMMRREVAGILDVPLFRVSMQWMLGPEGFAEVKTAAVEKAVEMLAIPSPDSSLREHYRRELAQRVAPATARVTAREWAELWQPVMVPLRRRALVISALLGLALGATAVVLSPLLAG